VVLDITAIRTAVLTGRKFTSFLQDSQKNRAVIMEPVFTGSARSPVRSTEPFSRCWVSGEFPWSLRPLPISLAYSQFPPVSRELT
jgi:hypothetical protein